jgi:hypothetical protein
VAEGREGAVDGVTVLAHEGRRRKKEGGRRRVVTKPILVLY